MQIAEPALDTLNRALRKCGNAWHSIRQDMAQMGSSPGRDSARIVECIREEIARKRFVPGRFLPATRELGSKYGVSSETVRRALKVLERDHIVQSESRHGFRILARAMDPDRGAPVAFVISEQETELNSNSFYGMILSAIRMAAAQYGWSLLSVSAVDRSHDNVLEQLRHARVAGVFLDMLEPALVKTIRAMGLPAILVDAWDETAGLDAVQQDHFGGAVQAAKHVAHAGHSRVGWVGSYGDTPQFRERWGGVSACLQQHGVSIPRQFQFDGYDPAFADQLRAVLQQPDRPTAMIAPWGALAPRVARVVTDLGLSLGRDVELVGWSAVERYDAYAASFPGGTPPPTVVWSLTDLAEAAVARLAERRAHPDLAVIRIQVATQLRQAEKAIQKENT